MRRFCILTIMLLLCSMTFATDLLKRDQCDYVTIPYVSVDAENKPVVLSALICYPTVSASDKTPAPVSFVVLNNHPTIMKDSQAPTGDSPLDAVTYGGFSIAPHGAMNLMTTEGALVISCDYLGYGYSRNRMHPYCNHTLTARNVIDGYLAAMDTVKARGIQIADDYYTYSVGYSQGGSVTMAVQKYLETEAPEEVRDIVKLKKSFCGAGPYNLDYIFRDLCSQESLTYSCSLPLTLEALYSAYHEGCMKQVDLDSIYVSHEFRQAVKEVISNKEMTTEEVCDWINNYFGKSSVSISDLFRTEAISDNGPTCRALVKALKKCNMLDGSWVPQTPMVLFHYTGDEVVEYGNSEQATALFGDKVKLITEKDNLQCTNVPIATIIKMLLSNPKSHSDYGTLFYAYFIDGVLRNQ